MIYLNRLNLDVPGYVMMELISGTVPTRVEVYTQEWTTQWEHPMATT